MKGNKGYLGHKVNKGYYGDLIALLLVLARLIGVIGIGQFAVRVDAFGPFGSQQMLVQDALVEQHLHTYHAMRVVKIIKQRR